MTYFIFSDLTSEMILVLKEYTISLGDLSYQSFLFYFSTLNSSQGFERHILSVYDP